MFRPREFQLDDKAVLQQLLAQRAFGVLVTGAPAQAGAPAATHLPFLLDTARGPFGTLRSHVARRNPHWKALADAPRVLCIFELGDAYVSPRWYAQEEDVPTWNYAAIHASGCARLLHDDAAMPLLAETVAAFEARLPGAPWSAARMSDPAMVRALARAVVPFEVEIDTLEGVAKLSQDKLAGDLGRVREQLALQPGPGGVALAALMQRLGAEGRAPGSVPSTSPPEAAA